MGSGGARVVPIRHDWNTTMLTSAFKVINGLLLPGGDASISPKSQLRVAADTIFQLALTSSKNGNPFPIFGHCLGFELLNVIVANDNSVLTKFDAENISLPLQYSSNAPTSR